MIPGTEDPERVKILKQKWKEIQSKDELWKDIKCLHYCGRCETLHTGEGGKCPYCQSKGV